MEEGFFRFDQLNLQSDRGWKAAPTGSNQYSITPALQHSITKVLL
jgi:hypothetical protein